MSKMETEAEIMKNKGKIRMSELKIKALISILAREGVVTTKEVEEEVSNLLSENKDNE